MEAKKVFICETSESRERKIANNTASNPEAKANNQSQTNESPPNQDCSENENGTADSQFGDFGWSHIDFRYFLK